MALPIQYPLVGGNRHSSASAELKIFNGTQQIPPGLPFAGWSRIKYAWELTPVYVKGHHPDPIAMTIGETKYELEWEVWLAEYNLLLSTLGQGFATMYLQFQISYTENGFDTIVDTINGVRLTGGDGEATNNADPLKRTIKCMPLKILPNGVDLLAVPLSPLTA